MFAQFSSTIPTYKYYFNDPTSWQNGEIAIHIGVFGPKQQFVIQLSEETAFTQGARILGEALTRSIYSIPGGVTLQGEFTLKRLY